MAFSKVHRPVPIESAGFHVYRNEIAWIGGRVSDGEMLAEIARKRHLRNALRYRYAEGLPVSSTELPVARGDNVRVDIPGQ